MLRDGAVHCILRGQRGLTAWQYNQAQGPLQPQMFPIKKNKINSKKQLDASVGTQG